MMMQMFPSSLYNVFPVCAVQLTPYYLKAMDAIYASSPTSVIIVEGTGQQSYTGLNWGDGFVTDQNILNKYYLSSNPNAFFTALLKKPYLNNVAISPHVYPPSVSYQTVVSAANFPNNHKPIPLIVGTD